MCDDRGLEPTGEGGAVTYRRMEDRRASISAVPASAPPRPSGLQDRGPVRVDPLSDRKDIGHLLDHGRCDRECGGQSHHARLPCPPVQGLIRPIPSEGRGVRDRVGDARQAPDEQRSPLCERTTGRRPGRTRGRHLRARSGLGRIYVRIRRRRAYRLLSGRGLGGLVLRRCSSSPTHVHRHSMHIYTYAKSSHSFLGIAPAPQVRPSAGHPTTFSAGTLRRTARPDCGGNGARAGTIRANKAVFGAVGAHDLVFLLGRYVGCSGLPCPPKRKARPLRCPALMPTRGS